MSNTFLVKTLQVMIITTLFFVLLYFSKPVLMPFTTAALLAMLFLPICKWMEDHGMHRLLASVLCTAILLLIVFVITSLITWQLSNVTEDLAHIKRHVLNAINNVQHYISTRFGITPAEQNKILNVQPTNTSGMDVVIASVMSSLVYIIIYSVLIIVYMVMLLYFRTHFRNFILKLVPNAEQSKATTIIAQSSKVVQEYLAGLVIIIVFLWIMYSIGFAIVGVKNPIFFAILCGLLEIVPFVGNITGSSITSLMALSQGGGLNMVIGVLITYAIIQSIQFYLISPIVMAAEVNINPVFTIAIIIVGQLVWGIPGMILSIPLLGITKIICDNIEPLKPYGYLIGSQRTKTHLRQNLMERFKSLFVKSTEK